MLAGQFHSLLTGNFEERVSEHWCVASGDGV